MRELQHIGFLSKAKHATCLDCNTDDLAVKLLDEGMGDYKQSCHDCGRVLKPGSFGWAELYSRRGCSCVKRNHPDLEYGNLRLSPSTSVTTIKGKEIHLTDVEFRVLLCLVKSQGKFVATEDILREVWGENFINQKDYVVSYVKRLRWRFGSRLAIASRRGFGYAVCR